MSRPTLELAVSNIAWLHEDEERVAAHLESIDVHAVEIAPTKVFGRPTEVSAVDAEAYRTFWKGRGIDIVAFQSILFGHPDLHLFAGPDAQNDFVRVSQAFISLADRLGARRIVFGSPRQRRVPSGVSESDAWETARDVFTRIAVIAESHDVVFCIEPNPVAYDCNFVTNAADGERLVREVDRPGFGLHLDTAAMLLADDDYRAAIESSADVLNHVHMSAPNLGALDDEAVDYADTIRSLHDAGYSGRISIEMRPPADGDPISHVARAVEVVRTAAARSGVELER